jgi:hypothetical protein
MQTTNFGDERFQCILLVSNYQIKSNEKSSTIYENSITQWRCFTFCNLETIKPLVQNYSVLQKL